MDSTRLILFGGFLGAGKTTLMARTARHFADRGNRVGLIANDQAGNLVDTAQLAAAGFPVAEVAGGCFCCRFDELAAAADRFLAVDRPNAILAEPVGSCTDLVATVIRPMERLLGDRLSVAPYSVLVDPDRAAESLEPDKKNPLPDNVAYIFRKQLEEADAIVLNKIDLLSAARLDELRRLLADRFPDASLFAVSAATGHGFDPWFQFIESAAPRRRHSIDVDYDVYADGEAALGWFNAAVHLKSSGTPDWSQFAADLLDGLCERLDSQSAEIAHLKFRLTAGADSVAVNVTESGKAPTVRGRIAPGPREALLLLNARVRLDPEPLQAAIEESLATAAAGRFEMEVGELRCFSPGRPCPTHRIVES